jgi:hypothetical protein
MDEKTRERNAHFNTLKRDIDHVLRDVAAFVQACLVH